MVECMEAWILADRRVLREHYGQKLQETALPARVQVEQVSKLDLYDALARAVRQEGGYKKGTDAFKLLEAVDPRELCKHPWAGRFFSELGRRLSPAPG